MGAKYRKWQEASLLLRASRTAHEAAVEQLRVTGNKYKEQATLLKDLLQAQAQSFETNFQYQKCFPPIGVLLPNCAKRWEKSNR